MKTSRSQASSSPDDPLHPWPPAYLVPFSDAAEFLGKTEHWMKRARADGFMEFVKMRNSTAIRAAELYRLIDEHTFPARPRPPVRRTRTSEHNAKIGVGVRAATKKRNAAKKRAAAKKAGR